MIIIIESAIGKRELQIWIPALMRWLVKDICQIQLFEDGGSVGCSCSHPGRYNPYEIRVSNILILRVVCTL